MAHQESLDKYVEPDVREEIHLRYGEREVKVSRQLAEKFPTLNFAVGYTVKAHYDNYDVCHLERVK